MNKQFTTLAVGKPYTTIPMPQIQDGAAAQFLTESGNILQIRLSQITEHETWAMKKGKIKAGFLYDSGCLLWIFQFQGKGKHPITFDCPFDVKIIPGDVLALHSIDNQNQRLAIEIHVVDENDIVRALRLVTLSNEMTVSFLSAVQDQLTRISADNSVMDKWMELPPEELLRYCKTIETLGEK